MDNQSIQQTKAKADQLKQQGDHELQNNQLNAAKDSFQQALVLYQSISDLQGQGKVLNNLGLAYGFSKEINPALEFYQLSLEIARRTGNHELEEIVLSNLGTAYVQIEDTPKAIEFYELSLIVSQKSENSYRGVLASRRLGQLYENLGNYREALGYYHQVLEIYQDNNNYTAEIDILWSIIRICYAMGNLSAVINHLKRTSLLIRQSKRSILEKMSVDLKIIFLRSVLFIYNASTILLVEGATQFKAGNIELAVENWENGLDMCNSSSDYFTEWTLINNLGIAYLKLNKTKEFEKCLTRNSRLIQNLRENWIKFPFRETVCEYSIEKNSDVFNYYQYLANFYQEKLDQLEEDSCEQRALLLGVLGTIFKALEDYPQAIYYFQKSIKTAREIGDVECQGFSLTGIGKVYYALSIFTSGVRYFQKTLTILFTIRKDLIGKFTALFDRTYLNFWKFIVDRINKTIIEYRVKKFLNQSFSSFGLKNFDFADHASFNALYITRFFRKHKLSILILLYDSYMNQLLGRYETAIDRANDTLKIAQRINDIESEALCLLLLSHLYFSVGNYHLSISFAEQVLNLSATVKLTDFIRVSYLCNFGGCYIRFGRYKDALENYGQALYILKQIRSSQQMRIFSLEGLKVDKRKLENFYVDNHYRLLSECLQGLGLASVSIGNHRQAFIYFQEALEVVEEIEADKRLEKAAILDSLGTISRLQKKYDQAIEYHEEALSISREIRNRKGEGIALGNIGLVYICKRQYEKAYKYLLQALSIAREIGDKQSESVCMANLALNIKYLHNNYFDEFEETSYWTEMIEYQQQQIANSQTMGDYETECIGLRNLANNLLKIGDLEGASEAIHRSIEILESFPTGMPDMRGVSVLEEHSVSYSILQEILVKQEKFANALEVSERSRTRILCEILAKSSFEKLATASPINCLSLAQIQETSSRLNSTIVEYTATPVLPIYIWIIKPNNEIHFHEVDTFPLFQKYKFYLENLVLEALSFLGVIEELAVLDESYLDESYTSKVPNPMVELYQLLIEPIESFLNEKGSSSLVFIPHGFLFLLPFSALQNPDFSYLLDKYDFRISPSIQVLDVLSNYQVDPNRRSSCLQDILVIGNPLMPILALDSDESPTKLVELPWSEVEAKTIANLFAIKPLIRENATKEEVISLMPNAKIIHFATHSLLYDIPMQNIPGAIALSPKNDDKGFLSADEISRMQLKAELVVLSACRTGRGYLSADGVIGISRSFIEAGVSNIIVSLWSVDDASTSFLMLKLYQNRQQGMTASKALNNAQRWLSCLTRKQLEVWLQDNEIDFSPTLQMHFKRRMSKLSQNEKPYKNPFYWAAFQTVGLE